MPLADILVHVNPDRPEAPLGTLAARLAADHGARLHGLTALWRAAFLKLAYRNPPGWAVERIAADRAAAEAAGRRFVDAASAHGAAATWSAAEGAAAELVAIAGRLADLIVLEQGHTGEDDLGGGVPDEVVLGSGWPVLVVPREGDLAPVGRRVVLAWNHSRQAALAARGALPILIRAQSVLVLLGPEREEGGRVLERPRLDVGAWLARHGAKVEERPFHPADREAGEAILAAAGEAGADLVVMGAYGHSWLRERVLGGATRHVLTMARLPVLMAH